MNILELADGNEEESIPIAREPDTASMRPMYLSRISISGLVSSSTCPRTCLPFQPPEVLRPLRIMERRWIIDGVVGSAGEEEEEEYRADSSRGGGGGGGGWDGSGLAIGR